MKDTCAKELVEEHFSLLYFKFLLQNKIIDEDNFRRISTFLRWNLENEVLNFKEDATCVCPLND